MPTPSALLMFTVGDGEVLPSQKLPTAAPRTPPNINELCMLGSPGVFVDSDSRRIANNIREGHKFPYGLESGHMLLSSIFQMKQNNISYCRFCQRNTSQEQVEPNASLQQMPIVEASKRHLHMNSSPVRR